MFHSASLHESPGVLLGRRLASLAIALHYLTVEAFFIIRTAHLAGRLPRHLLSDSLMMFPGKICGEEAALELAAEGIWPKEMGQALGVAQATVGSDIERNRLSSNGESMAKSEVFERNRSKLKSSDSLIPGTGGAKGSGKKTSCWNKAEELAQS